MNWRRVSCVVICLASACWSSEPLVDETFTQEQWEQLQQFTLPAPVPCRDGFGADRCELAARFGKKLFFDQALSGSIKIDDPSAPGAINEVGKVSCATCHDAGKPDPKDHHWISGFLSDTRPPPNQVSIGADYTKHNALGLINTDLKRIVAEQTCGPEPRFPCLNVSSWNGQYTNSGEVLTLALTKAMNTTQPAAVEYVRETYPATYASLFGRDPCPAVPDIHVVFAATTELYTDCDAPEVAYANLVDVFDAYERRLTNRDSAFDRYIAGDFSALAPDAKRGLALFIGKAMCVDCHRGPLLSDLQFHNTGVPQRGAHVPAVDGGLDDCIFGGPPAPCAGALPADDPDPHRYLGAFLTQPLRNVAQTAPYMHDGAFATLREVIDFYRSGGVGDGSFSGTRDPRIQPLDLTDDEAGDLEAFLRALTGAPVDPTWVDKRID